MPRQSQFQNGYQAALADITAAIESVEERGTEYFRLTLNAVEEWIRNNTPNSIDYRGYTLVIDSTSAAIWKDDELISTHCGPDALDSAKTDIDSYVEVRR